MIVLRLYQAGKIGFLDSDLRLSIATGGLSWQNLRCGLSNNWNLWHQSRYIFSENKIKDIAQLRSDISKLYTNQTKTKFIFSAIDRFMTSYEQESLEDRILDLMISLEALLQTDIAELKYRLAIRTATFLETDPVQRNLVYKIIKEGYHVRSKTAHGAKITKITINGNELTLEDLANQIEEIVRRAIKEFIKRTNQEQNRDTIIKKLDDDLFLIDS